MENNFISNALLRSIVVRVATAHLEEDEETTLTADMSNGVLPTSGQRQKKTKGKFRMDRIKEYLRNPIKKMKEKIRNRIKRKRTPRKKYEERARNNPEKVERKPSGGARSWSDYSDDKDWSEDHKKRKDDKKKWEDTPQAKRTRQKYYEKNKNKQGWDMSEEHNNTDKTANKRRKKFPKGTKRRVMKNLKKRNPAQFKRNTIKRKRKKRLNMGGYIKKKIRQRINMRKPINRLRKNLRQKFKRDTGLKSLKRGGLLTAPEILVALVPKIDVVDQTILMAFVHSVSPMTGMVTFVTETNTINSLPLEVFMEIAVPMTDDHADSLAKLIFAELGELELLPVSRQDVLDCTADLLTEEQKAQCTEIATESVQKGLGADKGVRNRVKSEPDEMNRLTRFYAPFRVPILQEPVVFGGVLPLSELEEEDEDLITVTAKRVASFYREQQHPSKMDKKDDKSDGGTPQGDDDSSTMSSPGWVTPQTGAPYNQDIPSRKPSNGITQPAVYDNPGSAKVIPSGRGFVNKMAERIAWRYLNEK